MKGLLVTHDFPPAISGGISEYYANLVRATHPTLEVIAPRVDYSRVEPRLRPVATAGNVNSHGQLGLFLDGLQQLWVADRLLRRRRYDFVIFGHLHLAVISRHLGLCRNVPSALVLHGGEMASLRRTAVGRGAVTATLGRLAGVLVNSEATRASFQEVPLSVRDRWKVLNPGVDASRFEPPQREQRAAARNLLGLGDEPVLLTVARLVSRKGHADVLRALGVLRASYPSARYLVVGDGPERSRLESLTAELGLKTAVTFLGHVSLPQLSAAYAAADIFVMPSKTDATREGFEGFGIVYLEAGAAGLPVVGARSGGVSEAVLEDETGLLVTPGDVGELTKVLGVLFGDPALRSRLGKAGRLRAVGPMSWPERGRMFRTWIEQVVGAHT